MRGRAREDVTLVAACTSLPVDRAVEVRIRTCSCTLAHRSDACTLLKNQPQASLALHSPEVLHCGCMEHAAYREIACAGVQSSSKYAMTAAILSTSLQLQHDCDIWDACYYCTLADMQSIAAKHLDPQQAGYLQHTVAALQPPGMHMASIPECASSRPAPACIMAMHSSTHHLHLHLLQEAMRHPDACMQCASVCMRLCLHSCSVLVAWHRMQQIQGRQRNQSIPAGHEGAPALHHHQQQVCTV